jgi:hypothetical protein
MKLAGITKIGAVAAILTTALAVAAPASADSYRGDFGDRDGASMHIVVRDDHRDFRHGRDMWQRDAFFRHARFHHYGWDWRHHDREFRY